MKRLTALLLCICMVFSLISCAAEPDPTSPPTEPPTEAPTEPPAAELYQAAYDQAAGKHQFMMTIHSVKTTSVAGLTFTQDGKQTIYFQDYGSDAMKYRSSEEIIYNDLISFLYEETFIDGMLYASVDYSDRFRGEMDTADAALRNLSPTMIDPALYSSITQDGGSFRFENPTAAESWAMPEGSEMGEAHAEAVVNDRGELENLGYYLTYTYGPAEITLEVDAELMFGPTTVNTPTEADSYTQLQDVDAVYLTMNAQGMLMVSDSASTTSLESVMSQAAAVTRNQSTTMNVYWSGSDIDAKIDTSLYFMDYSSGQSTDLEQEEKFVDGVYTVATNGGEPEAAGGVTGSIMEEYCSQVLTSHIVQSAYWQDAEITDLGSTLLIELTMTDDFGDTMEGAICTTFWNDARFLRNLSSAYECTDTSAYIAIDKYLGLPTAGGYYYEGKHTIDGQEYLLTLQSDQSIDAASPESYHNITEELLPEEEPAEKATPLFYHVTGADGQEMWLLGTIHVGDERTGFLPQEIYDAFAASDALALEFDSEAFEEAMEEDDKLQEQVSAAYYYSDGTKVSDHVDEEIYETAVQFLKASGNYNMNAPYLKPSMWGNAIENFYMRQGYSLTGIQGMEERLTKLAHELEKPIYDVESGLFQVQMLTGWSEELHALLLEDALSGNAEEYFTDVQELYELWCAGDEAALRKELSDEVDFSELTEEEKAEYEEIKHLLEEYNKAMSYDRNDGMLQKAIEYLESGETVFYAVGLAHLLNNVNGLVDTLRAAGYTVELVAYAG